MIPFQELKHLKVETFNKPEIFNNLSSGILVKFVEIAKNHKHLELIANSKNLDDKVVDSIVNQTKFDLLNLSVSSLLNLCKHCKNVNNIYPLIKAGITLILNTNISNDFEKSKEQIKVK